jgi:hypothetical protein
MAPAWNGRPETGQSNPCRASASGPNLDYTKNQDFPKAA